MNSKYPRRHILRNVLINAVLLCGSLLIAFFLLEAVFSAINKNIPEQKILVTDKTGRFVGHEVFNEYHSIYGMNGIPDLHVNRVQHNSRGHRGPEYRIEKSPGLKRVLFLGDSNTWGYGIADKQTRAAYLQIELKNNGSPIEVVNLGVTGFGTDQSLLKFLLEGSGYQPDWVILEYFHLNDMDENSSTEYWGVPKPKFWIRGDNLCLNNVPVPLVQGWSNYEVIAAHATDDDSGGGWFHAMLSSSEVVQFFSNREFRTDVVSLFNRLRYTFGLSENRRTAREILSEYQSCDELPPEKEERFELTMRLMQELDRLVEANGGRLAVMMTPTAGDYKSGNLGESYKRVQDSLVKNGIDTIDLWAEFHQRDYNAYSLYLANANDDHFSPEGQRLSALLIAEYLKSEQ